jgi:hypothetical protein
MTRKEKSAPRVLRRQDVPNVAEVIYLIKLDRFERRWWRRLARWWRRVRA